MDTKELIERLRAYRGGDTKFRALMDEAASELSALRQQADRLLGQLGDGDEEKREEYRKGGYHPLALFADFADPGEVGFDAGWEACKAKIAALQSYRSQNND